MTLYSIYKASYMCICNPYPLQQVVQPLIPGHQMIGSHYNVIGDRHDRLQVSCNSVYKSTRSFIEYVYM